MQQPNTSQAAAPGVAQTQRGTKNPSQGLKSSFRCSRGDGKALINSDLSCGL